MKKIILKFDELTGETTLETKGFKGKECIEESQFIKKALGIITKEEKTNEYYKQTTKNKQQQKRRW